MKITYFIISRLITQRADVRPCFAHWSPRCLDAPEQYADLRGELWISCYLVWSKTKNEKGKNIYFIVYFFNLKEV